MGEQGSVKIETRNLELFCLCSCKSSLALEVLIIEFRLIDLYLATVAAGHLTQMSFRDC
jgi:hypothetical protein